MLRKFPRFRMLIATFFLLNFASLVWAVDSDQIAFIGNIPVSAEMITALDQARDAGYSVKALVKNENEKVRLVILLGEVHYKGSKAKKAGNEVLKHFNMVGLEGVDTRNYSWLSRKLLSAYLNSRDFVARKLFRRHGSTIFDSRDQYLESLIKKAIVGVARELKNTGYDSLDPVMLIKISQAIGDQKLKLKSGNSLSFREIMPTSEIAKFLRLTLAELKSEDANAGPAFSSRANESFQARKDEGEIDILQAGEFVDDGGLIQVQLEKAHQVGLIDEVAIVSLVWSPIVGLGSMVARFGTQLLPRSYVQKVLHDGLLGTEVVSLSAWVANVLALALDVHPILHGRNKIMVAEVDAAFEKFPERDKMLIIVGAAHVNGMSRLLQKKFKYQSAHIPLKTNDSLFKKVLHVF